MELMTLIVNGEETSLYVEARTLLVHAIRDQLAVGTTEVVVVRG